MVFLNSKKNILLTGAPSSGKTTVIKKVINKLTLPLKGFFTEEEISNGRRTGFMMRTLSGQSGYLAHQNIDSKFSIRRYGVSIPNIEKLAVPSIKPCEGYTIILDEIGKMECFSEIFRNAVMESLDSLNSVIGTITLGGGDFIDQIKKRDDIELIEVMKHNRNSLPEQILGKIVIR